MKTRTLFLTFTVLAGLSVYAKSQAIHGDQSPVGTFLPVGSCVGSSWNMDSNTFVVDCANDRVGIGSASPATTLDVDGTATATIFILEGGPGSEIWETDDGGDFEPSASGSDDVAFELDTGLDVMPKGIAYDYDQNGDLQPMLETAVALEWIPEIGIPHTLASSFTFSNADFSVGGSTLAVNGGLVGIGTTVHPYSTYGVNLDVVGGIVTNQLFFQAREGDTVPYLTVIATGSASPAVSTVFQAQNDAVAPDVVFNIQISTTGADEKVIVIGNGSGGAGIAIETESTRRLFISTGGNVAIGTNTPATKLDVAGGINATTATLTGSDFSVGSSTFVVTGGSVGIGTTAPAAKLDVAGTIAYSVDIDTAVTVPGRRNVMGIDSGGVVWVSSSATSLSWQKVGAQ